MTSEVIEMQGRALASEQAAMPPVNSPMGMMLAAVKSGATLDQVEKMMDLQERWEANEARKAYVAAMAAFKAEPITIIKAKQVSFTTRDGDKTSYSHAELSDVTEAIGPAMAKHDLSFRWNVRQADDSRISVDCIITHVQGHSETVTMSGSPDASGKKNAIQQSASTVTYLQRYTLLAATGLSTKGQDDDGTAAGAALLDGWLEAIEQAEDVQSLDAVLKDGTKALSKQKGAGAVENYRAFMAAVQARNKALKAASKESGNG